MAGNTPDQPLQMDESSFRPLDKIGSQPAPAAPSPSSDMSNLTMDPASFKPLASPSQPKAEAMPAGQSDVGAALGTEPIKTSDIPAPSKDTQGGYRNMEALPMDWSGLKDVGKEILGAAKGAVTGAADLAKPAQNDLENKIQGIGGPAALPIYRALLGMGHSAKEATEIVGAVKDINSSADPLGAYAKALQKTSSQGAAQATLALATEGALKAAPKVADVAGDLYKNAASKINSKYLQEPLQTGIRDVLDTATKTEPAPEPKYVYRARDVGEAGIPKPHASSHGQAMEDINVAKEYASSGQRGAVGRGGNYPGEEVPQEVVRVNLNKLKPEDFRANTARAAAQPGATPARGGIKYDFPNGLPEDAVEKLTPELEAQEAAAKTQQAATPPKPSASIRDAAEEAADKVHAQAKADYKVLDEASNGRIQRFRDRLEANRRKLLNLTDSEEDRATESSILKNQKETEDSMADTFEEMKKNGVNPDLVDRADANFKKSQALYELDNAIKKSVVPESGRPGVTHPDLYAENPEAINPKILHRRINSMYDSGRLQDALGEEQADEMFRHTSEHSVAYDRIMRNRKRALVGGAIGASALGGGGYIAHKFGSQLLEK